MNWNSRFWLEWNWVIFLPLTVCLIYRLLTRPSYKKLIKSSDSIDTICRILLFPALMYYVLDSIYLLYHIELYGWCNLAFFTHHIFTLAGFKASLTVPHYPWFFLATFPSHALLIMFPYLTELNYLYLGVILNFLYTARKDPWRYDEKFSWIFWVASSLLVTALPLLWMFECKNDMENIG